MKYTFIDFRRDIVCSSLEMIFEYDGKKYDISIVPGKYKLFGKKKISPLWRLYNITDNIEMLRTSRENICDEIYIDGKKLVDIWNDVKVI